MQYVMFSLWFTWLHVAAYTIAGAVALALSKDLYEHKSRLLDYLRDMGDEEDRKHVQKFFLPAQLLRGVLLSIVLYPVLGLLGDLSFALRFAFLAGLFFIYLDFGSSVPFNNNIEGFVYMKQRYLKVPSFWKLYLETVLYSILLAGFAGWLLF